MDIWVNGRIEKVPPQGSHLCHIYNSASDIVDITSHLIFSGIHTNEQCLFFGEENQIIAIQSELEKLKVNVIECIGKDQLRFSSDRSLLLTESGNFDHMYLLGVHKSVIDRALQDGWKGIRLSIDMQWLIKETASPEQILKYEAMSDAIFTFQNSPIIALMHYEHHKLLPRIIIELIHLHPISIVGTFLKRNPEYINAERYLLRLLQQKIILDAEEETDWE